MYLPDNPRTITAAEMEQLREWLRGLNNDLVGRLIKGFCTRCESWDCSGWCDYQTPLD